MANIRTRRGVYTDGFRMFVFNIYDLPAVLMPGLHRDGVYWGPDWL
ncbi:MAG: hypothetical protein HRU41_37805 [Saprospiraceae bacterium]|nr:hypothetical protein [Saprospiraceae bacterium]